VLGSFQCDSVGTAGENPYPSFPIISTNLCINEPAAPPASIPPSPPEIEVPIVDVPVPPPVSDPVQPLPGQGRDGLPVNPPAGARQCRNPTSRQVSWMHECPGYRSKFGQPVTGAVPPVSGTTGTTPNPPPRDDHHRRHRGGEGESDGEGDSNKSGGGDDDNSDDNEKQRHHGHHSHHKMSWKRVLKSAVLFIIVGSLVGCCAVRCVRRRRMRRRRIAAAAAAAAAAAVEKVQARSAARSSDSSPRNGGVSLPTVQTIVVAVPASAGDHKTPLLQVGEDIPSEDVGYEAQEQFEGVVAEAASPEPAKEESYVQLN